MKKTLLLVSVFCFSIVAMAQDYVIAAYSNAELTLQHEYEQMVVDQIEALPQVDYVDVYTDATEWAAIGDYIDDYDALILFESPSSSNNQIIGQLGFPKPFICFEPWVLHKDGWNWYAQADGFFNASALVPDDTMFYRVPARYTEVIVAADHPIFTGFGFNAGDEVVFSDGGVDLANSENDGDAYGIDLTAAITDIADAATPLAQNKLALENDDLFGSAVNMWAIEENATTPRAFIYGQHAADLENQTPEMNRLMKNAMLWILSEEITASAKTPSTNNVRVYINAASDLVVRGVKDIESITVYNLAGQAVKSVETSVNTVNVSELNKGIYMVSVKDTKGLVATVKVIK